MINCRQNSSGEMALLVKGLQVNNIRTVCRWQQRRRQQRRQQQQQRLPRLSPFPPLIETAKTARCLWRAICLSVKSNCGVIFGVSYTKIASSSPPPHECRMKKKKSSCLHEICKGLPDVGAVVALAADAGLAPIQRSGWTGLPENCMRMRPSLVFPGPSLTLFPKFVIAPSRFLWWRRFRTSWHELGALYHQNIVFATLARLIPSCKKNLRLSSLKTPEERRHF